MKKVQTKTGQKIFITWVNSSELDRRIDGGTTFFYKLKRFSKNTYHGIIKADGRYYNTETKLEI